MKKFCRFLVLVAFNLGLLILSDNTALAGWARLYGDSLRQEIHDSVATADGEYLVVGATRVMAPPESGLIIKLNSTGQQVWAKSYGNGGERFNSIIPISGGHYLVAGKTEQFGSVDGLLMEIDGDGNVLWLRTYGGPYIDTFHSIASLPDGNFILAGGSYSLDGVDMDAWLVKVNPAGDIIWSRLFTVPPGPFTTDLDEEFFAVTGMSDSGVVAVGKTHSFSGNDSADVLAVRVGSSGDLLWLSIWNAAFWWDVAHDVIRLLNGNLLLTGYAYLDDYDLFLLELNPSDGSMVAQRLVSSVDPEFLDEGSSLVQAPSGEIAVAGYSQFHDGEAWRSKVLLMKFVSSLNPLISKRFAAPTPGEYSSSILDISSFFIAGNSNGFIPNGEALGIAVNDGLDILACSPLSDFTLRIMPPALQPVPGDLSPLDFPPMENSYSPSLISQTFTTTPLCAEAEPDITVIPPSWDFGTVIVGGQADKTIQVRNDGTGNLNIGNLTSPSAPFSIVNDDCSNQSLAPSGTCTITARFSPPSEGNFNSSFQIPSNDPDENPFTVNLSGTGVTAPQPDISVEPPSHDYGGVIVGQQAEKSFQVTNLGNADLVIGTIVPPSAPFSISSDACSNQTLAPSATCEVRARFAPTSEGAFNSNFQIPSNDPDEPNVVVTLAGKGATPDIDASPNPLVFPTNQIGTAFSKSLFVQNKGAINLNIGTVPAPSLPFLVVSDGCSGQSISPSGFCYIEYQFFPPQENCYDSQVSIPSNDPDENPYVVLLEGCGYDDSLPRPYIPLRENKYSGRRGHTGAIEDRWALMEVIRRFRGIPSTTKPTDWPVFGGILVDNAQDFDPRLPPLFRVYNRIIEASPFYWQDTKGLEEFLRDYLWYEPTFVSGEMQPQSHLEGGDFCLAQAPDFKPEDWNAPDLPPNWDSMTDAEKEAWFNQNAKRFVSQYHNNCYNYACNTRNDGFAQPGAASNGTGDNTTCAGARANAISDGLQHLSDDFNDCKTLTCPPGTHKVVLVVGEGVDFHWYRQDSDGGWSDKPGGTPAKKVIDEDGDSDVDLDDVKRDAEKDRGGWNYNFCACFCDGPASKKKGLKEVQPKHFISRVGWPTTYYVAIYNYLPPGGSQIDIERVEVDPPFTSDPGDCPGKTLNPWESCYLTISFTCPAEATYLGVLRIVHPDPSGTVPEADRTQEHLFSWECRNSWDPNDKLQAGQGIPYGDQSGPLKKFIIPEEKATEPIIYHIMFENKKEATAPAEDIVITDELDQNLDLSTLQFLGSKHQEFLTYQLNGRILTFRFDDINLPPNVNPPEGEGWVTFSIHPNPGLPLGAEIHNKTSIVFDVNPPIDTSELVHIIGYMDIQAVPDYWDFGQVLVNSQVEIEITVSNIGGAPLSIGAIPALNQPYALAEDSCSNATLLKDASCTIKVRFAPTSAGIFPDNLSIPSDDPDENPLVLPITGRGITGSLAVARGPATLPTSAQKNQTKVAVLQFRVNAGVAEGVKVEGFTLQAGGDGNDQTDILAVRLFVDSNADGAIGEGDTELWSGQYSADNGTAIVDLTSATRTIPANGAETYLVTYDFAQTLASSSLPLQNKSAGLPHLPLWYLATALLFFALTGIKRLRSFLLILLLATGILWLSSCGGGGPAPAITRSYQATLTGILAKGASSNVDATITGLPVAGPSISVQK